jgi:hypothetical protein
LDFFVTQNAERLRPDGNAALAGVDLDAGYLLSFLAVDGRPHGGDDERGAWQYYCVTNFLWRHSGARAQHASPESIAPLRRGYRGRVRRFAAPRNDWL